MSRRRSIPIVGALAVAVAVLVTPVVSGADDGPTAATDRTSVPAGERVQINGSGWQPGTIVVAELCGNEALDGAVDCAPSSAVNVGVQPNGTFIAQVTAVIPPSPCPCVVQLSSTSEVTEVRIPIEVVGAATAPPLRRSTPGSIRQQVEIRSLELDGGWLPGVLGLGAERTLTLEVENTSQRLIPAIPLQLTAGGDEEPTEFVQAPTIVDLEPGEIRAVSVPVEFAPLTFGKLHVDGALLGVGESVRFTAETSNPPILPIALAVLVVQWVLLRIRDRIRKRIAEPEDLEDPGDEPVDEHLDPPLGPEGDEVIDLRKPDERPNVDIRPVVSAEVAEPVPPDESVETVESGDPREVVIAGTPTTEPLHGESGENEPALAQHSEGRDRSAAEEDVDLPRMRTEYADVVLEEAAVLGWLDRLRNDVGDAAVAVDAAMSRRLEAEREEVVAIERLDRLRSDVEDAALVVEARESRRLQVEREEAAVAERLDRLRQDLIEAELAVKAAATRRERVEQELETLETGSSRAHAAAPDPVRSPEQRADIGSMRPAESVGTDFDSMLSNAVRRALADWSAER